jgi:hypothetical protein
MSSLKSIVCSVLVAVFAFLLLTCAITLAGALIGAVLFLCVGKLFGMDFTTTELIQNGLFDGGFLALIWAPGVSFVTILIQANRRKRKSAPEIP